MEYVLVKGVKPRKAGWFPVTAKNVTRVQKKNCQVIKSIFFCGKLCKLLKKLRPIKKNVKPCHFFVCGKVVSFFFCSKNV